QQLRRDAGRARVHRLARGGRAPRPRARRGHRAPPPPHAERPGPHGGTTGPLRDRLLRARRRRGPPGVPRGVRAPREGGEAGTGEEPTEVDPRELVAVRREATGPTPRARRAAALRRHTGDGETPGLPV